VPNYGTDKYSWNYYEKLILKLEYNEKDGKER
jgi:hypothetical protein